MISFLALALVYSQAAWSDEGGGMETQAAFIVDSKIIFEESAEHRFWATDITLGCYGTNLRGYQNPLGKNATETIQLVVKAAGKQRELNVTVPANIFFGTKAKASDIQVTTKEIPGTPKAEIITVGKTTYARVTAQGITLPTSMADGSLSDKVELLKASVTQKVGAGAAQGSYTAKNGPLTAKISHHHDKSGLLIVKVSAAGENQFCGSYYSPLMAFFDSRRPEFTGKSRFPVGAVPQTIVWVEPGAPGYLLALDENKDGKISERYELFGDAQMHNGFDALAFHDMNKDKKIDAKDKVFSRLLLWQDKNGDGVSQSRELIPLSKKRVVSIDLNYTETGTRTYSSGAELRQNSSFVFLDESGARKEGRMIDVWFGSYRDFEFAAARPMAGPAPFDLPLPPPHRVPPAWIPTMAIQ